MTKMTIKQWHTVGLGYSLAEPVAQPSANYSLVIFGEG